MRIRCSRIYILFVFDSHATWPEYGTLVSIELFTECQHDDIEEERPLRVSQVDGERD